jgi:hypothetical protein
MARNPNPFPTVGAASIFPMPWDPNSIIPVVLIVTVRRIRSVIVESNGWRRGYQYNRGADKDPKVRVAARMVSASVPMPVPG